MAMFTATLANAGKYAEGSPDWVQLSFPTTTEKVQTALRYIGVDGIRYEEILIGEYSTDIPGFEIRLGEYAGIDELNFLANRLQEFSPEERNKFASALVCGADSSSVQDLINLTFNLDCYEIYPEVEDEESYGRFLIEELGALELSSTLENYFDYEAYGRDISIKQNGVFTQYGYIFKKQSNSEKEYDGVNIPKEYRVFQYPARVKSHKRRRDKGRKKPCL